MTRDLPTALHQLINTVGVHFRLHSSWKQATDEEWEKAKEKYPLPTSEELDDLWVRVNRLINH